MQKLFTRKVVSLTLRSNRNQQQHHHGLSCYSSFRQPLQQAHSNSLMKVLSNPLLLKRFSPNATSFFVDHGEFGGLRAQFRRFIFQFNQPNCYQKTWWLKFRRRRLTVNGVLISLIATNVVVFLLWQKANKNFMRENFMNSLVNFRSGRYHTLITYAFSHHEQNHIASNMIGLYFFGKHIGQTFGPGCLLKLYLAGAVVGSAVTLGHKAFLERSSKDKQRKRSKISTLGASGAVNAIMLLDMFLFPTSILLIEFIPVPAIFVGIYLIWQDIQRVVKQTDKISGSTHLGGAAVAAIAWTQLRKGRI